MRFAGLVLAGLFMVSCRGDTDETLKGDTLGNETAAETTASNAHRDTPVEDALTASERVISLPDTLDFDLGSTAYDEEAARTPEDPRLTLGMPAPISADTFVEHLRETRWTQLVYVGGRWMTTGDCTAAVSALSMGLDDDGTLHLSHDLGQDADTYVLTSPVRRKTDGYAFDARYTWEEEGTPSRTLHMAFVDQARTVLAWYPDEPAPGMSLNTSRSRDGRPLFFVHTDTGFVAGTAREPLCICKQYFTDADCRVPTPAGHGRARPADNRVPLKLEVPAHHATLDAVTLALERGDVDMLYGFDFLRGDPGAGLDYEEAVTESLELRLPVTTLPPHSVSNTLPGRELLHQVETARITAQQRHRPADDLPFVAYDGVVTMRGGLERPFRLRLNENLSPPPTDMLDRLVATEDADAPTADATRQDSLSNPRLGVGPAAPVPPDSLFAALEGTTWMRIEYIGRRWVIRDQINAGNPYVQFDHTEEPGPFGIKGWTLLEFLGQETIGYPPTTRVRRLTSGYSFEAEETMSAGATGREMHIAFVDAARTVITLKGSISSDSQTASFYVRGDAMGFFPNLVPAPCASRFIFERSQCLRAQPNASETARPDSLRVPFAPSTSRHRGYLLRLTDALERHNAPLLYALLDEQRGGGELTTPERAAQALGLLLPATTMSRASTSNTLPSAYILSQIKTATLNAEDELRHDGSVTYRGMVTFQGGLRHPLTVRLTTGRRPTVLALDAPQDIR